MTSFNDSLPVDYALLTMEFDTSSAIDRRTLLRWGVTGASALALPGLLGACGGSSSTSTSDASTTVAPKVDPLLTAARREGAVNLIGVDSGEYASYRYALAGFRSEAKIKVNLQQAIGGAGIQLGTVRAQKGKKSQPDVIDTGLSAALEATKDKLVTPFRPEGWADIPSAAKDIDGNWLSAYYVLVGIVSNPALLKGAEPPATFADLKNLPAGVVIGMPGDPRSGEALEKAGKSSILAGSAAFGAVWTAALTLPGGSLDNIGPGIDFFAELADAGSFVPGRVVITETAGDGTNAVAFLDTSAIERARGSAKAGNKLELRIDSTKTLFPNYYAQAVVKGSPHPNAGKLWIQHLVSDEGAVQLLKGGQVPTRFPVLEQRGLVEKSELSAFENVGLSSADLVSKLSDVQIPTVEQMQKAQEEVDRRWAADVVGKK